MVYLNAIVHCSMGCSGRQANQERPLIMSKTKNTAEKVSKTAEASFYMGADSLKTGFDKTAKIFESATEFGKDTVEAYVESATIAGKGFQVINGEAVAYSKEAIEEFAATAKAVMGSKSIHEAIELQTGFVKNAFAAYVAQVTKYNEKAIVIAKESYAPLQGRAEALTSVVQSVTAA
jgi:phasin family protein